MFAGIQSLDKTGNTHQTVRMNHRGNYTRAARERDRDDFLTDSSQSHTDKFFQAEMRSDFFRQNGF